MSRDEQPQVNVLMPWFMGGSWVPKFGGGEPSKFQEWRNQIEACIRAQGLNEVQQVDFVLSALEGNAKREILLLVERERNTDVKILNALASLYGGQQPVAQLRIQFFNCKQQPGEGVGPFTLRLRELHHRWRCKREFKSMGCPGCSGKEKGWVMEVLRRLSEAQRSDPQRLFPIAAYRGISYKPHQGPVVFNSGFGKRVLASGSVTCGPRKDCLYHPFWSIPV